MAAECAKVKDPAKRLHRYGRSYLEWAVENPDAYYVLFCRPGQLGEHGEGPSYPDLLNTLAEIHDRDANDPALFAMAFAFWSAVHGLATLCIASPSIPEEARISTLQYFEAALNTFGPPESQPWASEMIARQEAARNAPPPRRVRSRF
nr:TetR-like C-terminal domain-containing protein [Tessaracoccus sp. OS52]